MQTPTIRTKGYTLSCLAALLLLGPGPIFGRGNETPQGWQPQPPMPDDFDWVQLTSGEWLKGEVIAMYDESLEFDSDKLDLLSLDWADVSEIRTAGTMQVGFADNSVEVGRILVGRETIRVLGVEERQRRRSEILTITAGKPKEINYWSMKASLGANLRRGNSEQVETTGKVNLIRRTVKNRIILDYLASFNETDGVTVADNQRASAAWNRYVSKRMFWAPLLGELFRDPFQNIDGRWSLGAGVGYELIDTPRVSWEISGGPAYQETRFVTPLETGATRTSTPAFVGGTIYTNELTGWMDFLIDYTFFVVDRESGTYTHHFVTGLELELTRRFDLDITLIWDRIEDPQPDAEGFVPKQDDLRTVLSLGFDF